MKKIKFLISTLFAVFFIAGMSDVVYAYDYQVTNKIVGETNDKSQDMKYMLMGSGDITISGADNVKSMGVIGIWCDCGFDIFSNENWHRHEATGCHASGAFPYNVYSFSMKNNTTATLSGIGTFHLYRVYDSAVETNNQTVTYYINSRNYRNNPEGSMDVCDIQSADGLKGIKDGISGSVVIYNSDGSRVTDSEMSTTTTPSAETPTTTTTTTTTTTAAKPKLNKTKAAVNVGKTVKLKVTNYKNSKVTWSSSNKKVATVTSNGKVKGIKAGKATITAKVGQKSVKCKITVRKG
jgi:hypothetical protein